jgi:integrase
VIVHPGPSDPVNPARVYHDSKALGSRSAIRAALNRIAGWLLALDRAATWNETCGVPWGEVRAEHVRILRARLAEQSAPRTTNRDLSLLRSVLEIAWELKQMSTDDYHRAIHVKGVDKDKTKAGRALSPDELRELRRAAGEISTRAGAVLALMYGAGLRRFEIGRLDLVGVDLDTGAIDVPGKRNKRRVAYLAPGLLPDLRRWIEERGSAPGPLFDFRSPKTAGRMVEEARGRAGIKPFTPHDLRRSFGTHLLGRGRDVGLVKELLGHDDLRTTLLYDRREAEKLREAVAALDGIWDEPDRAEKMARFVISAHPPPRRSYDLVAVFAHGDPFGDPEGENIDALRAELHEGNVTMEIVPLPSRDYDPRFLGLFSGRTVEHRRLCAQVADWIEARGWKWHVARRYCEHSGGIADVADIGGRLFAECGYTRSWKILKGLEARREMLVVPYLGTSPTIGFHFKAARDLTWRRAERANPLLARGGSMIRSDFVPPPPRSTKPPRS